MEKVYKTILVAVLVIVLVNVGYSIFSSKNNIKEIGKILKHSQEQIDAAVKKVIESKLIIDSIQKSLTQYQTYLMAAEKRAQLLNNEYLINKRDNKLNHDSLRKKDEQTKNELDSLTKLMNSYEEVDTQNK